MTTEKQLTVADLARLPPEIKMGRLAKRAGLTVNAINVKVKRHREGKADALSPEQSAAMTRALREVWEELGEVIGGRGNDGVL